MHASQYALLSNSTRIGHESCGKGGWLDGACVNEGRFEPMIALRVIGGEANRGCMQTWGPGTCCSCLTYSGISSTLSHFIVSVIDGLSTKRVLGPSVVQQISRTETWQPEWYTVRDL